MKRLRSFEISFARTMSQPSLNASSDGVSQTVCYVQWEKQDLPHAGVFIEPLQFYLLTDVSAGRKDKTRTNSHQKNNNHCNTIGDRIISHR
jgi:hypothetical protein